MFSEPVSLSFVLKTIAVVLILTAIGIYYVNKKRGN